VLSRLSSPRIYDSKCLTLLQAHNHAYVTPIIRWGSVDQARNLRGPESRDSSRHDGDRVYIDYTYQNGRYNEHGVARHGYAADAPFIHSPRDARYHYAKRFGIEASYRLSEQMIATTTTQNPVVRLLYAVVSLLLQNVWRYLHWEYVATPRRGGRRLWEWSSKEFTNMIRRAAWTALVTRRAVPANRPPDERFSR
jgi:IS4 transposase